MSDPAEFTADDLELPGLEAPSVHAGGVGAVEASAHRTLAALEPVLDDRAAVMTQALVTLARQLDRAATSRTAKDYGVANLVAQLRETYLVLMPETTTGGDDDAFDRLARELGSAAALRDSAQPAARQ